MGRYILKRFLLMIPTLLGVAVLRQITQMLLDHFARVGNKLALLFVHTESSLAQVRG